MRTYVTVCEPAEPVAEPVTEPEEGWGRGLTVKEHVVKYALKHFMGYSYSDVDSKKVERNEARPDIIRAYLLDLANAYDPLHEQVAGIGTF